MKFIYDDGGRYAAGYKGSADDCAVRSIAIAAMLPYQDVYDLVNEMAKDERLTKKRRSRSSARSGVRTSTLRKVMERLGWRWVPTMTIGSGCTVHLADGELPMGRLVVAVSKHYTAVIEGVIYDTFDPSERGTTIYPAGYLGEVPKKAVKQDDGSWHYAPARCVYGYYVKV